MVKSLLGPAGAPRDSHSWWIRIWGAGHEYIDPELTIDEHTAVYGGAILAIFEPRNTAEGISSGLIGLLPGVGELQDVYTLLDPDEDPAWRAMAAASLALNIVSAGLLPNFSGIAKGARAAARAQDAARAGNAAADAAKSADNAVDVGVRQADNAADAAEEASGAAKAADSPEASPRSTGEAGSSPDPNPNQKKPSWSKARSDYWKERARTAPAGKYSAENLDRMRQGRAPRHEDLGVSKELHHIVARRDGGADTADNLMEVWP